jgi:heme exporter protein D
MMMGHMWIWTAVGILLIVLLIVIIAKLLRR